MKFAGLLSREAAPRASVPLTDHDDALIWAVALLLSIGFAMVY